MMKGSIQEEDIIIVNIYAPNIGVPQYTKQTLTDIKGEINSNTIIVGDFNTPLTEMDRSSKYKINMETWVLNDTLDEIDLIDIFRTFHPNAEKYTFFSSAHGTFSMINHILGHKTILNKFKRIKIISSFCSDHSGMKLEVNYLNKIAKYTNFRGKQHATKCFKREIKNILRQKWKYDIAKTCGMQQRQF